MVRSFCSMGSKDKMRYIETAFATGDKKEKTSGAFSLFALLRKGESVVYETRAHWIYVVPFVAAALLLSRFTMGISLLLIISGFFKIKTHEYLVTEERILMREGFVKPKVFSLPLREVERVSVEQNEFGKKFGVGHVSLTTIDGDAVHFRNIEDPRAMSHYIRSAIITMPCATRA